MLKKVVTESKGQEEIQISRARMTTQYRVVVGNATKLPSKNIAYLDQGQVGVGDREAKRCDADREDRIKVSSATKLYHYSVVGFKGHTQVQVTACEEQLQG